ncbi:hypothetical protein LINPERHAP1_LOCUS42834, partial [Linum perenne]
SKQRFSRRARTSGGIYFLCRWRWSLGGRCLWRWTFGRWVVLWLRCSPESCCGTHGRTLVTCGNKFEMEVNRVFSSDCVRKEKIFWISVLLKILTPGLTLNSFYKIHSLPASRNWIAMLISKQFVLTLNSLRLQSLWGSTS